MIVEMTYFGGETRFLLLQPDRTEKLKNWII